MTLKVVEPIEVTEAVLAASDITEPDTARGEVEWVANRFSGQILTDKQYPNQGFLHGAYYNNTLYVLENNDGTIGAQAVMHKYDSSGSHIGQFDINDDIFSFCIDEDNELIVGVGFESGLVTSYNINTESLVSTYDISTEIPSPQGIAYGDSRYWVLDPTQKRFVSYDPSFSTTGSIITLQENTTQLWSAHYLQGGLLTYINRTSAKLNAIRISDGGVDYSYDISKAAGQSYDNFGHYYISGELYVINYSDDASYKFVDGVYAGFYQPGDRVIKTSTHQVYQCLTATSQDPEEGATEDSAATWIVVGPTNKWAMFDNLQNTKTINDTDFTVTLNPITYVNTLAVLGFSGVSSVRVEVDNTGGTTIYDKTFTASDFSAIYDHYTYVFYQIVALKKLIVEDLPPLPNTTIRVTFSGADMQIGELAFGFAVNIGTLVANGTKSDRFRYREQQYNEFGYPTGAAPIVVELNTYDVLVPKLTNPSIQKLLDGLTGKNTLWVGDIGSDQRMITYGFFERSPIPFNMPNDINYQITVRASV